MKFKLFGQSFKLNQSDPSIPILTGILMLIIFSGALFAQTVFSQQDNLPQTQSDTIEDFNSYSYLDMRFKLNNKFNFVKQTEKSKLNYISVDLTFFPKSDDKQKIQTIEFSSNPKIEEEKTQNEIKFRWDNPLLEQFSIGIDSTVRMKNIITPVNRKISFPLQNDQTASQKQYTEPSEYIDTTPEIKQKAMSLAQGEDDLYEVTFKIADWVENNIHYSLNTLTEEVVQKSSWVLRNKEGVCDELTNLFISMLRSLNIPAKYVSGMAYTNLDNTWGSHAWAEVYFPGVGWVPFDVTYSQFGWIDPSHIKLKSSFDSNEPSIKYQWEGKDVDFKPGKIGLNTELISMGEKIDSPLTFSLKPLTNNVGPGSYVPLELEIENQNSYYIPNTFTIIKGFNLTEKNVKSVLSLPTSKKKIYWITVLPLEADQGYIYTATYEVQDQFHKKASTTIIYSRNFPSHTLADANKIIRELKVDEEKVYSSNLFIDCTSPDHVFTYELLNINCNIKNTGNVVLQNIEICAKNKKKDLQTECKKIDLGIAEEKNIALAVLNLTEGLQTIKVVAEGESVKLDTPIKVMDSIVVKVLHSPDLVIRSFDYPETVKYKDKFEMIMITTVSAPVNYVKIMMNENLILTIPSLEKSKRITISTKGRDFLRHSEINLTISFEDENNKQYTISKYYPIGVANIPWYIRFLMWLKLL